jgi:hypothetical protein
MFSENQCRIARVARALAAYRKYEALGREMTKYSLVNQARIERVARALYDAAPSESEGDPEQSSEQPLDEQGEQAEPKTLSWDDLDDAQYPNKQVKQEFRVMAAIAIEAMTLDDDLDESLRQFQLPAIMGELTSLKKTDALRVLNAAIDRVMESENE